jgi:DNA polymerase
MLVTLDFETYYDTKVSLTKLTTMDYVRHDMFKVWGVGIKIDHDETQWYGEDEAEAAIREIDWSDVTLVCHNTPFDGYILTRHYGVIPKFYVDTAAMSRGLFPGKSASLRDTAIRMFPHDKTMRKGEELADAKGIYDLGPELDEVIGVYCIQDVDLTYAIYRKMIEQMPLTELELINLTCRMFCEPRLTANLAALTAFRDETIANSEALIAAGDVDRKVLSSNQQFAEHIRSMGLVPPTKRSLSTGKTIPALGKNDKAYQQMTRMYPQFQHVWGARKAVKSRINETRAQRFIDARHDDGTISVPLRYYAAHTGRFGGTEKLNMQNMPRKSPLRTALEAPEGHLVFVADLSNIEARMLAWLADEQPLLQQFRNGEDVYANLAQEIYSRPINKEDNPTERFVGKTAVLGLGYGMGADKFKNTLAVGAAGMAVNISSDEAFKVVSGYRTINSGIPTLWDKFEIKLASTIQKNYHETWRCLTFTDKKIWLPNGMALVYDQLDYNREGKLTYESRNTETTWGGRIAENVTQALSRIVITDAMLRIEADKSLDATIALTVHDEIIIIGNANNPDVTMSKLIEHMCVPPAWAPDLPLAAEGGYDKGYSK